MATVRIAGSGVNLPTFPGLVNNSAAVGVPGQAGYYNGLSNAITLGPGEIFMIPSGQFQIKTGPYTFVQFKDPNIGIWHVRPTAKDSLDYVSSDGQNWRLANTTGCPVGAVITSATATGAVNGIGAAINLVSCTPSSGASTWQTIVGGAISTTIATATTTAGTSVGSGYLYPPIIVIDAPPSGGLQATAYVTSLSNGTVIAASILVVNQGAGYPAVPNMTFINDPRDAVGSGAIYVTTLTATGQLTGLYPTNHGTALTGVPTLSFSIGASTATAIMNFTVTAYTTTGAGSSIPTGAEVVSTTNLVAAQTTPAVVNPLHAGGITFPRPARILAGLSAGTVVVTGQVVEDAGLGIQGVPTMFLIGGYTSTTGTAPLIAASVGGTADTSFIQPM